MPLNFILGQPDRGRNCDSDFPTPEVVLVCCQDLVIYYPSITKSLVLLFWKALMWVQSDSRKPTETWMTNSPFFLFSVLFKPEVYWLCIRAWLRMWNRQNCYWVSLVRSTLCHSWIPSLEKSPWCKTKVSLLCEHEKSLSHCLQVLHEQRRESNWLYQGVHENTLEV